MAMRMTSRGTESPRQALVFVLLACRIDIRNETIVSASADSQQILDAVMLIGLRPRIPAMPAIGITARIRATRASSHAQARLLMESPLELPGVASAVPKFDILCR